MQKSKRRILGIPNRIYLLAFIILGFVAARFYPPVLPHIQLPAEAYTPGHPQFVLPVIGPFYWTNTLTAMVIADILIVIIALIVRRAVNSGELVPKGFAGAVEALLEVIYNLTESTAGKWARQIFPWFAAITLFVLVVNWTELIPGVDSIGIIHDVHGGEIEGHAIQPVLGGAATTIVTGKGDYALIPWVRVLSTDLNFTVGLALISIFMTQVFGVRALGAGYFQKFINIKGFSASPIFGAIDFGVGILELVSEVSKILSFSFRLFGNIFAGTVLLFVIGTLVPVFAQSIFLMLEFFVGLIQAVVFGMLTMV
ncbi:MAG TPA: F0F1 ATP synthase subunit A, partial [Anaerolineales bacterium]|nr:F0F1 ATP synthase subunit A [Anaerolineales bacterium]